MAGLIDGIDPQTALLLGLSSGLLGTQGNGRRASFGEALANGMQQGTAGYRQAVGDQQRAQQMRMEQQAREQQMQLAREQMRMAQAQGEREAQMFPGRLAEQGLGNEKNRAELDAMKRAQQQADALRAALASLSRPVSGGQAASQPGGPTQQNATQIGAQPGGDDYRARVIQMIQSGQIPAAQGKALIESGDYGRAEAGHNVEVRLPDGTPGTRQLDKFGRPLGADMPKPYERKFQDLGGTIAGIDPYTGQPVGDAMAKSMTPDGVASNAVARGNLGVAQANLGLTRARDAFTQRESGGLVYNNDAGGYIPKNIRPGDTPTVTQLPGGAAIKPPNDSQGKAVLFGARMKQADQQLNALEAGGTLRGSIIKQNAEGVPLIGGALGTVANFGASGKQQEYEQAKRNFINATLRRESGAVIAESEFANAERQYFPQPGDTPGVLNQKRMNRQLATSAILYEAGPHAGQADRLIPQNSNVNGQSASGQIRPAGSSPVLRFDAQGNMIGG